MTTISVAIDEAVYERVAEAARLADANPEGLVRAYLDYLAAGGRPIPATDDDVTAAELAELMSKDPAWDWLKDEPDIYTLEDGEPI